MTNAVTAVPAADSEAAGRHFAGRLAFETDVADVAAALREEDHGLVLIDSRSGEAYAAGHLPGALNLPRPYAPAGLPGGLLVVYCWGPACNGATKAARELASLGRPVKEMIGGFEYWLREGHAVESAQPSMPVASCGAPTGLDSGEPRWRR